jgi:TolB protein
VRERGQTDIWAVSVGARNPLRILNDGVDDRDPSWSSDGTKLAFASRRDGNYEVYIYELVTQVISRITYDLSFQANPRWSNDGLWLAYESYQGNNLDVYAVPIDGSDAPVRITDHAAPDFAPVWSPDGRQIAFVSWRDGNQDIYIFNLDTLETTNFTATPGRNEDNPSWSPDGDTLAFSAVDLGRETIYIQPITGGAAQLIGRGRTPSWSPDGGTLVFAVDADDKSQTYLYAVPIGREGGISTEILAVPFGAADPVWSREILPPALVNSGGLPLAVTDALYIEQEEAFTTGAPYRLNALLDVDAPSPYLSDRVNDSFNALRVRVLEETGTDYLTNLEDAWWDLERLPEPGVERRNWHMTGRAFSITRAGILGFPAPLEIVREDTDTETYWRVYLRVAEEAQSGNLGEPLRRIPWDFLSRSQGDVEAYNQGGRLKPEIPTGYYVDFTQLAADYGWLPRFAGTDWRANSNSINYWMFWKPENLDWYTAMLEIHTEGELINFAPTSSSGQ